jgi:hypothetical protein
MQFVNLTSHPLNIRKAGARMEMAALPTSGQLARVSTFRSNVAVVGGFDLMALEIEGAVLGLPAPALDTLLVASAMVMDAIGHHRTDLVSPGAQIREGGVVTGCNGLTVSKSFRWLAGTKLFLDFGNQDGSWYVSNDAPSVQQSAWAVEVDYSAYQDRPNRYVAPWNVWPVEYAP